MHLSERPANRLLCAEPLEGRWLLSALASPAAAGIYPVDGGRVELIEAELVSEDDDGESDVEIGADQLPASVVATLEARFRGAQLSEAALTEEDGATEYSVTVVFNGETIGATLTPAGDLIETEQIISSAELPPELLEFIRENFPGSEVNEASTVTKHGEQSYEVVITDSAGQEHEAEMRVLDDPAPAPSDTAVRETATDIEPIAAQTSFSDATIVDDTILTQSQRNEPATIAPDSPPEPIAVAESDIAASPQARGIEAAARIWSIDATSVTEALNALAAGAGAAVSLPEVAEALSDALPIDLAAIERELKAILHEIDSLAHSALSGASRSDSAWSLAVIAALMASAQLLLLNKRIPRGGPLLVFNAANSSWSWVLGAATPSDGRS